ncbi:MAG TPA: sn-glycerol-3-phosphate ABC transporter ATP-binding protein UgpC [Gaiellales bacterium]|jgi:multiple sugar transport system ATP-binding protein|nr:sn-glycerol-3-phosphate ABC transporter ATP-binding protein UgpC [Gaiellales bacterium]
MASIAIEGVTKVFRGGVVAVDHVSLEIANGEFLVLVGPSGCGKTTLLRIVAGLEEVTDGEVMIGDTLVTDMPPRDRDVAMVFQNYALYPHMTVAENLSIGLRIRRRPKPEVKSRVAEVAHILGLDSLLERRPAELSGGQRQRVAMGRAMVREPQAFLMDEPLSNLDAKLRVQMRAELARIRDRVRTTTLYVTHDQVEAMTLGDRVAVMREGVVQQLDTPQNLYRRPANLFVAAFIGSPSMNLLEARIEDGNVCFADHRIPLHAGADLREYDGRTVVLGIRPGDFEDAAVWHDASRPAFDVDVDVSEELGDQVNVIFRLDAPPVRSEAVRDASTIEEGGADDMLVPLVADEGRSVCTACVDSRTTARPGGRVRLSVDPTRFHFFDVDTGHAIGAAGHAAPAPA